MRLSKFEYLEPRTIDDACSMLSEHKGDARLLAGGTDLLVLMKQQVVTPPYVVNLKSIPDLSYIEHDARAGLKIGPLTTLRQLVRSPIVQEKFPILAEAAAHVASPLIRNTATVGGNIGLDTKCWYYNQSAQWRRTFEPCLKRGGGICHVVKGGRRCFSSCCADTVPALMALGAELELISASGRRTLMLDQFFTGRGRKVNVLTQDEIVAEIRIANLPAGTGTAFVKLSTRGSIDYGLVDVAVMLRRGSQNGACTDAKVCIAAIGPGPLLATKAASVLVGNKVDESACRAAGEIAVKEAARISSVWVSAAYRRKMINVLVCRAVREAWKKASDNENLRIASGENRRRS